MKIVLDYLLTLDKPSFGTGSFEIFCLHTKHMPPVSPSGMLLTRSVSGDISLWSNSGDEQVAALAALHNSNPYDRASAHCSTSITPRASNVYRGIIHDCSYRTTFETVKSPSGDQGVSINPQ
jgi:hypothetical protein